MAALEAADCGCEIPCTCIMFEGEIYKGLETLVDDLVEQRDHLLSYVAYLERGGEPPHGKL